MSEEQIPPVEDAAALVTETPAPSETIGLDALSEDDFPQTADDVNGMYGANGELQPEPTPPAEQPTEAVDPAASQQQNIEGVPPAIDPAAPVDPAAPPVQQGPTFDQQVAALGIQGVTPENAQQLLLQQHQDNLRTQQQQQMQYGSALQMAQEHQALLQDPAYRAWQDQQYQASQQPAVAEASHPFENPYPEPNQAQLQRYTEQDGEGGIRWKTDAVTGMPMAPAKFREEVEAHILHKQNFEQRLRDDPKSVFDEALSSYVPQMVEKKLEEQRSTMDDEYYTEQIMNENREWMVGVNPQTGQQDWTPQGQYYGHQMHNLREKGFSVQEAHEYAFSQTLRQFAPQGQPAQQQQQQQMQTPAPVQQQPPQPLTPAQQAEAMKQQHLAAGGNILTDQSAAVTPTQQNPLADQELDISKFLDNADPGFLDFMASQH